MSLRNIRIIAKKDLKGLANERTILLAVLLQLFIALFSSFLMVGLTSLYDPSSLSRYSRIEYGVGYAGNDSPLEGYINDSRDFRVYPMDLSTAVQALKERKLAAVVYYPDTPPDANEPVEVTLYTLQNDIQAAIVSVKLKDILVRYETELRTLRSDRLNLQPLPLQVPATGSGGEFYEFIYG
ncbi:MAG: ABC transporter permease, partial [Methanoregulaceae archaeon]|nr:ABC transporter permease [Methanoregulaceae archaeon]